MNLNRKQFMAVLTTLVSLPGRLLAFSRKGKAMVPVDSASRAGPQRHGPWLADWRQIHRVPVFESVHPTAQRLILAALRHEMLTFRYWGGSTPGADRSVSLGLVFQAGGYGPLYVTGYCHLRREERVFRVDRLELSEDEDGIICITE